MWSEKFFMVFIVQYVLYYSNAHELFFRIDYKYIDDLKSFYKIHRTHKTWTDANHTCTAEDASLFYPNSAPDALEFMDVLSIFKGVHTSWAENGIADLISNRLNEKLDGISVSDLYNNWGPRHHSKYPFICKKTSDSLEECSLSRLGYQYSTVTGNCYKFHVDPMNWTNAYDKCKQEHSYLAVINSPLEAGFLVNLTQNTNKENVVGEFTEGIAHLGFLNKDNEGWKTIDGVSLEDSGYSTWSLGVPDGRGLELCGSMFYTGDLNDIRCNASCFFICEHDAESILALRSHRLPRISN